MKGAADEWAARARAAVVVAHPDDETLWAGGTVLMHPACRWRIVTLCRASDQDRAPKFRRALGRFGSRGGMADLDDGPAQAALPAEEVRRTVLGLLGDADFDLVLTHGPRGEYTRHRRHEEVARAVVDLWEHGVLLTGEVWMFAYEDAAGSRPPRAAADAHRRVELPQEVWEQKYEIITELYGFGPDSFEARAASRLEAFYCFRTPGEARRWLDGSIGRAQP